MSEFKCKMCGGTIQCQPNDTVGTCDSCGTKQTLPRLDSERKESLFDRADHYRRNYEYDKAMALYERILDEGDDDAEVYWSMVLCCYGIEYVEDPASHKRIPTVNRAQYTSILADANYKAALQYADGYQVVLYEEEAKAIDAIQEGILSISRKEEPFDVFICYKETDLTGRRTPDSVLATELYHELTDMGYKVFFSRITLEDKLGTEYEPYIFAALNSAKVMVVLGTKPEYFNAVWVKNEWSRYLALIKNGAKKVLIPAYRDMNPYDLPEEFSHLQAQDMSKLGFMQDLIRGIQKIVGAQEADEPIFIKETVVVSEEAASIVSLLKRAFLFLEDGDWKAAERYSDRILDRDPENGEAYLVKLMADMHVRTREDLGNEYNPFDENAKYQSTYQKILRFGNEKLIAEIKGYNEQIRKRIEDEQKEELYNDAMGLMKNARTAERYEKAANVFRMIEGYRDANELVKRCMELAEQCRLDEQRIAKEDEKKRKDMLYQDAKDKMAGYKRKDYEAALQILESLGDWKDTKDLIPICKQRIDELEKEERARGKRIAKQFRMAGIALGALVALFVAIAVIPEVMKPFSYDKAVNLYQDGKYEEAYKIFDTMLTYKDSQTLANECFFMSQKDSIQNVKVGDTIQFGTYEQDFSGNNGEERIEWIVLAVEDNKALLLSKYALDCKRYSVKKSDMTWRNSELRNWLNRDFLRSAFKGGYRDQILVTEVLTEEKAGAETGQVSTTKDEIFLLSVAEVEKYLPSDSARKCSPTEYATLQGIAVSYINETCMWWLRSTGGTNTFATFVEFDGGIKYTGGLVEWDDVGVRPAMWIQLD